MEVFRVCHTGLPKMEYFSRGLLAHVLARLLDAQTRGRRPHRETKFLTMRFKAITFDAGGTLIEPWPSVGAVYAEVAREFGIECSAERLTAQFVASWSGRTGFRYTREEWAEVVRDS